MTEFHSVKRRISVSGKSGIPKIRPAISEATPDRSVSCAVIRPTESSSRIHIDRSGSSLQTEDNSKIGAAAKAVSIRLRASGRKALREMTADPTQAQNFRAPVRTARPGEKVKGYTCPECETFAALLRSEKVPEHVIQASSRHKLFCAPSSTPPNIWEPWQIDSYPSTVG